MAGQITSQEADAATGSEDARQGKPWKSRLRSDGLLKVSYGFIHDFIFVFFYHQRSKDVFWLVDD